MLLKKSIFGLLLTRLKGIFVRRSAAWLQELPHHFKGFINGS